MATTPTFAQDMVINGAPAAWAYPIALDGDGKYYIPGLEESVLGDRQAARFRWNTIQGTPGFTLIRPAAAAAATTEEFLDILLANNTTIEFVKEKLTIDGADGSAKGGTGITAQGGVTGTMTFVTTAADIDSGGDYIDYLNKIVTYMGGKFLICMPLGFNYNKRKAGGGGGEAPIGYGYMIGTLSADFTEQVGAYAPATLTWTFASSKWSVLVGDWKAAHGAITFGDGDATDWDETHAIMMPKGLSGADVTGTLLVPADQAVIASSVFTANFQKLVNGEILFVKA